jgi:hypothetical protein
MHWLTTLGSRYKTLIAEFGLIAIATHLTIFVCMLIGVTVAVKLGLKVDGAGGSAGAVGVAYLATQVTYPLRIGITLLLTPVIATALRRNQELIEE